MIKRTKLSYRTKVKIIFAIPMILCFILMVYNLPYLNSDVALWKQPALGYAIMIFLLRHIGIQIINLKSPEGERL